MPKKPVIPKHHPSDEEHVLPPPPPPAERLTEYTIGDDPHGAQDIKLYVQSQARERVKHIEKVKEEIVHRDKYEVWDVTTTRNRWWVVTHPTNLYDQEHFPSLDYTLSFHIGLTRRALSQQNRRLGDDVVATPFDEVFRRMDQAQRRVAEAVEVEDFQAVGMVLREALLTLIDAMRREVGLPSEIECPQGGNFIEWSRLFINAMCPGATNKPLRAFLKPNAEGTWQLVNWLTHARNADGASATISYYAASTTVGHFTSLASRAEIDQPDECPRCGSRNTRTHFDVTLQPDGEFDTCGECGWTSHP